MTRAAMDAKACPYQPSWLNRLAAWITRLPGPHWVYYLVLGLVLFLIQVVALWIETPPGDDLAPDPKRHFPRLGLEPGIGHALCAL